MSENSKEAENVLFYSSEKRSSEKPENHLFDYIRTILLSSIFKRNSKIGRTVRSSSDSGQVEYVFFCLENKNGNRSEMRSKMALSVMDKMLFPLP